MLQKLLLYFRFFELKCKNDLNKVHKYYLLFCLMYNQCLWALTATADRATLRCTTLVITINNIHVAMRLIRNQLCKQAK